MVGASTLTQGIVVRRDYEAWFDAPARGESREITLAFGTNETIAALRRLDNETGSVQIRYQAKRHGALRAWLASTFEARDEQAEPGVLEFRKTGTDAYTLVAITGASGSGMHLTVGPTLYHNNAEALTARMLDYPEVTDVLESVVSDLGQGQAYYNAQIRSGFAERGWEYDTPVVPDLPLRCDFRKGDLQVEVEFGNARSYYQDYLKFLLPFTLGMVRVGALLVPTSDFARVLCATGTRRALRRAAESRQRPARVPRYSGMITYEKVEREFAPLRFVLNTPLVIIGLDFWGTD